MEGITLLEAVAQKVPRLRLGGGAIHRRPLWRQLRSMLEAPIRVTQSCGPANRLLAKIVKEPAADDFSDFRFVVDQQVLRDALHDLGNPLLPYKVGFAHLNLTTRQTDHTRTPARTSHRDRQVLNERIEALSKAPMTIEKIQDLIEKDQHGAASLFDHTSNGFGARRCG